MNSIYSFNESQSRKIGAPIYFFKYPSGAVSLKSFYKNYSLKKKYITSTELANSSRDDGKWARDDNKKRKEK